MINNGTKYLDQTSPGPSLVRRGEEQPPAGLFGNRQFMLLWLAYGISAMGDHISEMALLKASDALHAPNLTQLQAMISFMFMLPFFVLGPINGILADRLPRRGIMIFADLVRAALMWNFTVLIAHSAGLGTAGRFLPLLLIGLFAALFSPARSAFLPTLIRDDQLVRANAMTSGLGVIATMIAVALGGYLAEHYHPSVSFHIDAGTFLLSAVCLSLIRRPAAETERLKERHKNGGLGEGVRYIIEHRRVAQLIGVAVIVWLCGATVRSTIPAIVRDVYHLSYTDMGMFQARLALGMLAGALILTALGESLRSEIAITWSLIGIAISIGVLALSVLLKIPTGVAYHVGGFAIILSGMFAAGVMASYNALLQRIIPNRIRGRLFGLIDLVTMAGLLLATGLIGIPDWKNIDKWVGWILMLVFLLVLATGIGSLVIRLRSSPYSARVRFWVNVNRFYCHWWFRLKREGICTIPAEGPVLVIANHTCSIDPLLIIASSPNRPFGFMIAEEYSHVPIGGRLIRLIECIPVRRGEHDTGATKAALRHLKAGKPLGIFIEGRIPKPDEVAEPKEGAALLAMKTGAVVVPVHISGTIYDDSVRRSFFRRHRARVRFGKPIDVSQYAGEKGDKQKLREISDMLMERIRELAPDSKNT